MFFKASFRQKNTELVSLILLGNTFLLKEIFIKFKIENMILFPIFIQAWFCI